MQRTLLMISAAFLIQSFSTLAVLAQAAPDAQENARRACMADYRRHCAGVEPGEGRIVRCLRQNYSALTPECRQAMTDANPRGRGR